MRDGPLVLPHHARGLGVDAAFPDVSRGNPLLIVNHFVAQGHDESGQSVVSTTGLSDRGVVTRCDADEWFYLSIPWREKRCGHLAPVNRRDEFVGTEVGGNADRKFVLLTKPTRITYQRTAHDRMSARPADS